MGITDSTSNAPDKKGRGTGNCDDPGNGFKPSRPQWIISGLKTNFKLSPRYSAHKQSSPDKNL